MKLQLEYLNIFVVLLILHTTKAKIPGCNYLETVDLSFSSKLPNGTYVYRDYLPVPRRLNGQYDYIETERGINKSVERHTRECICQLKPCIWICCRFKDMQPNGECTDGLMKELGEINPYLNVTLLNGSVVRRNLLCDFIVLRDSMRFRDIWKKYEYTLFENGSVLLRGCDSEKKAFRGYDCLHPNQFSSGSTGYFFVAFHESVYNRNPDTLRPGANELILLSKALLVLTITVYLNVEKLRNLHGKIFISYMFTVFMFLLHKWVMQFHIPLFFCRFRGYLLYFFLAARRIWVSALSYQMWKGFRSLNQSESRHSFLSYSIFSWGTAAIMTGLLFLMDQFWDDEPSKVGLIPGVGWEYCDVKRRLSSKL
ncbi:probable G-protein coupled receptor Mth-like 6 [Drosophila serrata]|uniref:probable G-protein coupled receptor Mth-like 6 n=1 Tax=Drosophila serrata TaxID=7274 RepID=UPI000A1D25EF|nr:probable G-protein coupled receptor Mth-like 6 [Drosophila serrata]